MQPESKRVRLARDEQSNVRFEDDSSHLWAVSYADFLMVLLCFFLLFFSVDEKSRDTNVLQLIKARLAKHSESSVADANDLASGSDSGINSGPGTGSTGSLSAVSSSQVSLDEVAANLHDNSLKIERSEQEIKIQFSDDIFEKRQVIMSDEAKKILTNILTAIQPYKESIEIGFIGHSDLSTYRPLSANELVQNNYDLSSIRASRGLAFAVKLGFSPEQLFVIGTSPQSRNSRSLSLLIRLKVPSR